MQLFKSSTGYKRLDVYLLLNIIQLETLSFCRRFIVPGDDPCGRQFDQMTQAARSAVKNLTEGAERKATSAQTSIKLVDVAKASLCELRDDYLTFLWDMGEMPWRKDSEEAAAVYAIHFEPACFGEDVNYDLSKRVISERRRFWKWFGEGTDAATFANCMIILIVRALFMLEKLLGQMGDDFVQEGGFSERMTAARVEHKRTRGQRVDEDAPKCPECGGEMRLRHGKRGDFWGCINYPTCRGTKAAR